MMKYLAAVLVLMLVAPAWAEGPSAEDIVRQLQGGAATRSFGGDRGIAVDNAKPDGPSSIDLVINFDFNSARLTADGAVLAANLGRALADPRLAGNRFRIEGHTDAKGTAAYNQRLSEARAATVRDFLAARGIAAGRLEAAGYGFTRLLDAAHPESGVNRRVRVTNLGQP